MMKPSLRFGAALLAFLATIALFASTVVALLELLGDGGSQD